MKCSSLAWRWVWQVVLTVSVGLAGCSSGARQADWAVAARNATEHATQAYLSGHQREAEVHHERARRELARTGRPDGVARAELLHCAAQFASLQFPAGLKGAGAAFECPRFEALRAAATQEDVAYADFLAGRLDAVRIALLPAAQQSAAKQGVDAAGREAAIRAIADPLSRLVAAAAALRDGVLPNSLADAAIETASAQGWRRPLLAWLTLQHQRAQAGGETAVATALKQRINLVMSSSGVSR